MFHVRRVVHGIRICFLRLLKTDLFSVHSLCTTVQLVRATVQFCFCSSNGNSCDDHHYTSFGVQEYQLLWGLYSHPFRLYNAGELCMVFTR